MLDLCFLLGLAGHSREGSIPSLPFRHGSVHKTLSKEAMAEIRQHSKKKTLYTRVNKEIPCSIWAEHPTQRVGTKLGDRHIMIAFNARYKFLLGLPGHRREGFVPSLPSRNGSWCKARALEDVRRELARERQCGGTL